MTRSQTTPELWRTLKQVAIICGVSADTVKRWIKAGRLDAIDLNEGDETKVNKLLRVSQEEVNRFLGIRERQSRPQTRKSKPKKKKRLVNDFTRGQWK